MKWTKEIIRARNTLLRKHYAQFDGLLEDGPEWNTLARSGTVWDKIYQIRNAAPWRDAQHQMRRELAYLDTLRKDFQLRAQDTSPSKILQDTTMFCSNVLANFSWRSCAIEHNSLSLATAKNVEAAIPLQKDGGSALLNAMNLRLPSSSELMKLDNGEESKEIEYLELRNNIVALQAVLSSTYIERASTPENLLEDIRMISRILFRGMQMPFKAGLIRHMPVQVQSNPKAIFPYPGEVEANLERWSKFAAHDQEDIHPLIKGVWDILYYVSVHPFPDGNGRTSRLLFATHVASHGMIPTICTDGLSTEQYLKNVYSAMTKNPLPWCKDVILAQIDVLEKQR
ncbi:uncharacterized protein J4E78_005863 [Alternaria triticimaculans]|uniref:uncharacterized protein n=1 Tax=Alternaria triticimaculans TaxID=297637 RepID=UPI0020C3547C|nr:uncharacterized protein J4E78_005863 [Alternaria triticimaculans]KAI4659435.1 hypothetical protein J4E78_005863 [Alternaria triticimaculans]